MKNYLSKLLTLSLLALISIFQANAQIQPDTTVTLFNNWMIGDTVFYEQSRQRLNIHGTDTVQTRLMDMEFYLALKDTLPGGNLVFEQKVTDVTKLDIPDDFRKFIGEDYILLNKKLMQLPLTIITTPEGVVDQIELPAEATGLVDSISQLAQQAIDGLQVQDEQREKLKSVLSKALSSVTPKQTQMESLELFEIYGKNYPIDHTVVTDYQVPMPMFNNEQIDARSEFTVNVVSQDEDAEVIFLENELLYDSDQLINCLIKYMLTDDNRMSMNVDDPERPYASMSTTTDYYVEAITGTVLSYEKLNVTSDTDSTRMDYTVITAVR